MTRTSTTADVAVIGGGPAGATVATRLVQLGHSVVVIDRGGRRRSHQSETCAAATLDLLTMTGADRAVRAASFPSLESMTVEWDAPRHRRPMPPGSLLVERDRLDGVLLEWAATCGATVLRPALAERRRRVASGWEIELDGGRAPVHSRFVAVASGRPSGLRRSEQRALLAVTGRWDVRLDEPTLAAIDDGWVWGAPITTVADDVPSCEVTVFVDPIRWRSLGDDPVGRYSHLVAAAEVVPPGARLAGGVTASDATSGLADQVCGPDWLAVGDAALALDPLSSAGVQRAVQAALTTAIVVHTALTRPSEATVALDHYATTLARSAEHHAMWTGESYATIAAKRPTAFWVDRATAGPFDPNAAIRSPRAYCPPPQTRVRRSPLVRFVEVAQLVDDRVRVAPALEHPGLDGSVAYVGDTAVVPLLAPLDDVATLGSLVDVWSATIPVATAVGLAGWLVGHGVLEEVGVE